MKNHINTKKDQVLVFLLLFFSGNPFTKFLGNNSIIILLLILLLLFHDNLANKSFLKFYSKVFFPVLCIFIAQYYILDFVSWYGVFNFLLKIFVGGIIIHSLKDRFSYVLFLVTFKLSIISLVGYSLLNLIKVPLSGIKIDELQVSYFLYGINKDHLLKNEGMFWEPGAYAGILTLCLILNFKNLSVYWQNNKFPLCTIFITLLSTQSTTGYIVGVLIVLFIHLIKNTRLAILLSPIILIVIFNLYSNIDFLGQKIENQYSLASNMHKGDFSNTRFGSILFDWQYFKNHPIIGNGIHEKTRYKNNPDLLLAIKSGESLGHGNGFSNIIVSMGLIFTTGYFLLIYTKLRKYSKLYALFAILVIILNLQGENWLNHPLYLGLPFLRGLRK